MFFPKDFGGVGSKVRLDKISPQWHFLAVAFHTYDIIGVLMADK